MVSICILTRCHFHVPRSHLLSPSSSPFPSTYLSFCLRLAVMLSLFFYSSVSIRHFLSCEFPPRIVLSLGCSYLPLHNQSLNSATNNHKGRTLKERGRCFFNPNCVQVLDEISVQIPIIYFLSLFDTLTRRLSTNLFKSTKSIESHCTALCPPLLCSASS